MAYEYTRTNHLYDGVCKLVKKQTDTDENGIVKEVGTIEREVLCQVGGIYEKEFYDAYQAGIKAQYKLIVNIEVYENEKIVIFEGITYSVYRRFPTGDTMELYLREDEGTWD